MEPVTHPPAVGEVPTVTDGEPPDPNLRSRVATNQVRAARDWNDTAQDLVVNNIINENEDVRESRRELLVLVCLVLVLLIAGSIYSYRIYTQDRFVDQQRNEAVSTPYRPETIR